MSNVSSLKRQGVSYSVHITQEYDGTISYLAIDGVGDDPSPRSRNSIAQAFLEVANMIDPSVTEMAIDAAMRAIQPNEAEAPTYPSHGESGALEQGEPQ